MQAQLVCGCGAAECQATIVVNHPPARLGIGKKLIYVVHVHGPRRFRLETQAQTAMGLLIENPHPLRRGVRDDAEPARIENPNPGGTSRMKADVLDHELSREEEIGLSQTHQDDIPGDHGHFVSVAAQLKG